ncbi:transposase [Streptomyces bacillaris]|uniref:transposase n=1 Tax=Streptomyces bacillaris TaxID=68179 RepID=UPI0036C1D316
MNATLYVDRTGCQWACLPHDFPPHQSVYGYFARWQKDGVFAQLNGLLRELVRQQEGKSPEPTACVINSHGEDVHLRPPPYPGARGVWVKVHDDEARHADLRAAIGPSSHPDRLVGGVRRQQHTSHYSSRRATE